MISTEAYLSISAMAVSLGWFLVLVNRYKKSLSPKYRLPILISGLATLVFGLIAVVVTAING